MAMDSPRPLMTHTVLDQPYATSPIAQVGKQEVWVPLEFRVKFGKPLLQAGGGQHQAVSRHTHIEALCGQHSTML